MTGRVFIIHGWEGYPEEGWFTWLKENLENIGLTVKVPAMPQPDKPEIKAWVSYIRNVVILPDEKTYFVGHSIGCQAILRYLETLPKDSKVGGVVMVAGWVNLRGLSVSERNVINSWLTEPIKWSKVRKCTSKFTAIFSDSDPWVPIKDSKIFKDKLGSKIIIEKNKGHFSGDDNVKELPVVFEEVLNLIK